MSKQRDPGWFMRILEDADNKVRNTPWWEMSVELQEEFRKLDEREKTLKEVES